MIQAAKPQLDIGELVMHHTSDAYGLDFAPFGEIHWHRWPEPCLPVFWAPHLAATGLGAACPTR